MSTAAAAYMKTFSLYYGAPLWLALSLLLLPPFSIILNVKGDPITKPIISLCSGYAYSCAVFDNKKMKCWGDKTGWGLPSSSSYTIQCLGDELTEIGDSLPYVGIANVKIEEVTCSSSFACVKLDTGSISCIGEGFLDFSTGFISELSIFDIGTGVLVTNMTSGDVHNCVRTADRKVKCFGSNDFGQLGYGDTKMRGLSSALGDNLTYVDLGTNVDVDSIHSGVDAKHTCAILSAPAEYAQRIKCWGLNHVFQLGYGNAQNRGDNLYEMGVNLTLVDLGTESKVQQITISSDHTCALLVTGSLKCFGVADYGQLASGSTETISLIGDFLPAVVIDTGKTVKYVTTGPVNTCIVYDDMLTIKCVGYNFFGQLGQGDMKDRGGTSTTMIPSIPALDLGTGTLKIQSVHVGYGFVCVLFVDSSLKCFGDNHCGQLAIGSGSQIGYQAFEMGRDLRYSVLFGSAPAVWVKTSLIIGLCIGIPLSLIVLRFCAKCCCKSETDESKDIESNGIIDTKPSPNNEVSFISSSQVKVLSDPQTPANQKKYLAFLSHAKADTAPVATLIWNESKKILEDYEGNFEIFLDVNNLSDLRELSNQVKQTQVMVALQSKSYLTRPWCLIELYFALEYNIPIVAVKIEGAGYNFQEAEAFLDNLSKESLESMNPGASKEFVKLGIDINQLGKRLVEVLPSIISRPYEPAATSRVRKAQLDDLFQVIFEKANTS